VRLRSLRSHLKLPAYRAELRDGRLNLQQAAQKLGVSATVVYRLIRRKLLPATQIVSGAPWQIDAVKLASPDIIEAAMALKNRAPRSRQRSADDATLLCQGCLKSQLRMDLS
jgi:Helix-turn-helix domain